MDWNDCQLRWRFFISLANFADGQTAKLFEGSLCFICVNLRNLREKKPHSEAVCSSQFQSVGKINFAAEFAFPQRSRFPETFLVQDWDAGHASQHAAIRSLEPALPHEYLRPR